MQYHGSLRQPLRDIITSIGRGNSLPRAGRTSDYSYIARYATSAVAQESLEILPRATPDVLRHETATNKRSSASSVLQTTAKFEPSSVLSDGEDSKARLQNSVQSSVARMKDVSEFSKGYFRTQATRHQLERKRILTQRRQQTPREPGTWRLLLTLLDKATPAGGKLYGAITEEFRLPVGQAATFTRDRADAVLELMQRTGTQVRIDEDILLGRIQGAFTRVAFYGMPAQNGQAMKLLSSAVSVFSLEDANGSTQTHGELAKGWQHIEASPEDDIDVDYWQEQMDVKRVKAENQNKSSNTTDNAGMVRPVWPGSRPDRVPSVRLSLQRSTFSSTTDVSAYVCDITASAAQEKRRKALGEKISSQSLSLSQSVIAELVAIFSEPGNVDLVASEAVDRAFRYMIKHNDFASVRGMYKALEDNGYEFTMANHDILIAAAARSGDVHNFHYQLRLALHSNQKPTPLTWVAFHDLVMRRFSSQARTVVDIMRSKGLLENNKALLGLLKNRISRDFAAHLSRKGTVDYFFRLYDRGVHKYYRRPEFEWLQIDIVNRMIHVLLRFGRTQDAIAVIREYRRRNGDAALLTATLNTFLTSAATAKDPSAAVATINHFHVGEAGALVADKYTYSSLFALAWNGRYHNMLRVIWRYACAAGHVDQKMRFKMMKSLLAPMPEVLSTSNAQKSRQLWLAWAGKFAAGVRHCLFPPQSTTLESFTKAEMRMASWAMDTAAPAKGTPEWKDRRRLYHEDLDEVCNSAPVLPLSDRLNRAWEKDRRWQKRLLGVPESLSESWQSGDVFTEMMTHGIKVPMKAGDFTKESRAWETRELTRMRRADDEEEHKSLIEEASNL